MTLQEIKQLAARRGASFLSLRPEGKLPVRMRGKSGGECWLCVARGTDRGLVFSAASRFDKVHVFYQEECENAVED